MEYTTCKDSVMELISDGSKVFGRDYKISEEMLSKIDEICDGVDELVSEIECEILKKKQRHSVLSLCVMSLSFTEEEPTGSSS